MNNKILNRSFGCGVISVSYQKPAWSLFLSVVGGVWGVNHTSVINGIGRALLRWSRRWRWVISEPIGVPSLRIRRILSCLVLVAGLLVVLVGALGGLLGDSGPGLLGHCWWRWGWAGESRRGSEGAGGDGSGATTLASRSVTFGGEGGLFLTTSCVIHVEDFGDLHGAFVVTDADVDQILVLGGAGCIAYGFGAGSIVVLLLRSGGGRFGTFWRRAAADRYLLLILVLNPD